MKKRSILLLIIVVFILSGCVTKNKRILIIAAHEDDEVIGPGIVIQRAVEKGVEVFVIVTTDGAPKEFGHGKKEAEQRKKETIEALTLIGVKKKNIIFFEYDDLGFIFEIDIKKELTRLKKQIQKIKPDIIYVHAYEGGHIDHDATHLMVVEVVNNLRDKPKLYEFIEYNAYNWGAPVPSNRDYINNRVYPARYYRATSVEEFMKKSALKKYFSQHPFQEKVRSNSSLDFSYVSVSLAGEEIAESKLKNTSKEHLLKIATVDTRLRVWNPIERENTLLPMSEMTALTVYGKHLHPDESFTSKTDFVLSSFEKYYPKTVSPTMRHGYPNKAFLNFLDPEKDPSCLKYIGLCKWHTEKLDKNRKRTCNASTDECDQFLQYTKVNCPKWLNDYYACLNYSRVYKDFIVEQYGYMPSIVNKKYKLGSYYHQVDIDEPLYGGTIQIAPHEWIDISIGIANYNEEKMSNVTLILNQNTYSSRYFNITREIGELPPKTIIFDHIEYNSNVYHSLWGESPEPVELALVISGIDHNNETIVAKKFFAVSPIRLKEDIRIMGIYNHGKPMRTKEGILDYQSAIRVQVRNYGTEEYDEPVNFSYEFPELDIYHITPAYGWSFKTYIDAYLYFDYFKYPVGTYSGKVNVIRQNGEMITQRDITIDIKKGTYEIYYDKRKYGQVKAAITNLPHNPGYKFKSCDEHPLVCLFYWPDIIRKLPNYDYSKPPAEKVAYEKQMQDLWNKSFEDFVRVFANN
ncbi:MAG: Diacetylchitobiose deacetylase [Candidatus Woesearchaeota archaeon]|nr:Diacetylchitobiose deacetylase [Candidatus Woesearchaeota archaeon]